MRLPQPLIEGVLVKRENRYRARVRTAQREVAAFVPNPGRTLELLYPGARVLLAPATARQGPPRRTAYDLMLAYTVEGLLVSVDTRLAGPLFAEALGRGLVEPLAGYTIERREVVYGASRLDFRLVGVGRPPCLVEVKSSTLVEDGVAKWPDAPSVRGQRHVRELARAVAEGDPSSGTSRAVVVWVVQRPDARVMAPNRDIDPVFADLLVEAVGQGVEAYAFACEVRLGDMPKAGEIFVYRNIPLNLKGEVTYDELYH